MVERLRASRAKQPRSGPLPILTPGQTDDVPTYCQSEVSDGWVAGVVERPLRAQARTKPQCGAA
jgi:hypothetical protein